MEYKTAHLHTIAQEKKKGVSTGEKERRKIMNEKVQQEIEKNGRYIAFYINQKGEFFQKGYPSPFLRDKAIKKLKYAGVRNTGKANY